MIQSKYLTYVRDLKERLPNFYELFGSRIFVEVLPNPELKTAGGLILGSSKHHRNTTDEDSFTAVVVLATGTGYEDENGETVPLSVKPGQVIEVVRSGLRYYSSHPFLGGEYNPKEVALIKESDIHGLIAESMDEYNKALEVIGGLRASK